MMAMAIFKRVLDIIQIGESSGRLDSSEHRRAQSSSKGGIGCSRVKYNIFLKDKAYLMSETEN